MIIQTAYGSHRHLSVVTELGLQREQIDILCRKTNRKEAEDCQVTVLPCVLYIPTVGLSTGDWRLCGACAGTRETRPAPRPVQCHTTAGQTHLLRSARKPEARGEEKKDTEWVTLCTKTEPKVVAQKREQGDDSLVTCGCRVIHY